MAEKKDLEDIEEILDLLKQTQTTEKTNTLEKILEYYAMKHVVDSMKNEKKSSDINVEKLLIFGMLREILLPKQQNLDLNTLMNLADRLSKNKNEWTQVFTALLQLQQQQQQQQMQMQQTLMQMLFGSKFKEYEEKTKALEERIKEIEGGMVQELIALRDELKRISEKKEMSVSDLETVLEGYKKVKQLVGELAPELGYKKELVTKEGQINVNELLNTAITIIDKALSKYFAQKPPLPAVEKLPEAPIQQETPKLPETPLETPKEEKIEIKEEIKPIVASEESKEEVEVEPKEYDVEVRGETTETSSELPEESKEE